MDEELKDRVEYHEKMQARFLDLRERVAAGKAAVDSHCQEIRVEVEGELVCVGDLEIPLDQVANLLIILGSVLGCESDSQDQPDPGPIL